MTTEERLEVLHVQWDSVPREFFSDFLLENTKKGDYLATLPYYIPENKRTWRIPIPLKDNLKRFIPLYQLFSLRTMDFEKVRTSDGLFVWRRTNT